MTMLFLGKEFDPDQSALGARVELPASHLTTHGLIVGMTGSGKTGLAIVMLEELLRQRLPVLAIDPKGDLGNLLLLFESLEPAAFAPWIDPEAAARSGKTVDAVAGETAAAWRQGLSEWGLGGQDVAALARSHSARIYTPGSSAGRKLNVLQSLEAPTLPFDDAAEELRDEIDGIVRGVLGLLRVSADPLRSREYLLLSQLIEQAWRSGRGLDLETLIAGVADPPFDRLGALALESVYPKAERRELMLALNNLLASPSFASWREGDPLDVEKLLFGEDGRPRLSIVYTAHLNDDERLFITSLLLDKLKTWMRSQRGTSELRALLYIDELYGYFPPHPADPPTKRPLLTLLKQARSQGLGILLATQNPVDLDYKGLGNIGVWLIGRLQTEQDRARLLDGLVGGGAPPEQVKRLLGALRKRVFLLHDVHRPGPTLVQSRFTLSYLRGPLTREELKRLTQAESATAPASQRTRAAAAGAPVVPEPFRSHYLAKYGGELAEAHLMVKYAVRYKGGDEYVGVRAYPLDAPSAAEVLDAEPIVVNEAEIATDAAPGLRYSATPVLLSEAGSKGIEKALRSRLHDKLALPTFYDPVTRTTSQPGEARDAFATRLAAAGGGAKAEKLATQLDKKRRDLEIVKQDERGREVEKWAALGSAAASVLGGMLGGRRRSSVTGGLSKAGSVLSKNRMEAAAEARIARLEQEIQALEAQLQEIASVDPARLEERTLVPAKTAVKLLRYDLLWVY
jgi:DNA helicase HerA-like ATPase